MVSIAIGQEMQELFKIKIYLLFMIIHHILAEECGNKPSAPANANVKCLEAGGCRLICKPRYIFPTGEKNIYYECVEGKYKLKTDNPEKYKECKPVCKPPCGTGGNCIRPNTCDCQVGWDGKLCNIKVTPKPVITSTPIYSEKLVTTTQSSTTLLQSTTPFNGRSSTEFNVTEILDETTQTNATYLSIDTTDATYHVNENQDNKPVITDSMDMSSTINVAHIKETTVQSSTELIETTINTDSDSSVTSIITDSMDMASTSYDDDIQTTKSPFTELSETTINTDNDSSMASIITDSMDMASTTYDDYIKTTKSTSTELSETMRNTTQILMEFIQTKIDNEDDTTDFTVPEVSTEISQSTVLYILLVTESTNYPELNEFSTLLEDSTKVSQEKMMTEEELFSSNYSFSIKEETEITYNTTRSRILSTNNLSNFSTEETTTFHTLIDNHSINNSDRFSTGSTTIENSTSELFLTTDILYDTNFNITTHKNIIANILNNFGFGLQENADCGEPLWWLVPLLLAIIALLTSTNIILNILTLKWRKDIAQLKKRIGNHRKQSMPITFFRSLELNAEI